MLHHPRAAAKSDEVAVIVHDVIDKYLLIVAEIEVARFWVGDRKDIVSLECRGLLGE